MPCRSYETSWANSSSDYEIRKLKKEADKLARIACQALQELENNNIVEVLLLKDDEVRNWWTGHKEADRKARELAEEKARIKEAKALAMAKLSDEDKILLGLKKQ